MRNWLCAAVFLCGLVVATGMALVRAQDANQSVIHPHAGLKLTTFPDIPTCALGASESGDPTKEASTLFIHFAAGCNVPWHWHTPAETILMVSGFFVQR